MTLAMALENARDEGYARGLAEIKARGIAKGKSEEETDAAVKPVKNCDDESREYMTLPLALDERWAKGYSKGYAEGYTEGCAEGYAEGYAESKAESKIIILKEMVKDGILTIKDAAMRAGLSEESFRKQTML